MCMMCTADSTPQQEQDLKAAIGLERTRQYHTGCHALLFLVTHRYGLVSELLTAGSSAQLEKSCTGAVGLPGQRQQSHKPVQRYNGCRAEVALHCTSHGHIMV